MKQLIFSGKYRWIWALDIDTVITNLTIPAMQIITEQVSNNDIALIGEDCNGPNGGSWFLKSTDQSMQLLDEIWRHPNAEPLRWYEQAGIHIALKDPKFNSITKRVSNRLFNSYPYPSCGDKKFRWKDGDFVLHQAGDQKTPGIIISLVKKLHSIT
jgi:mannan polymerase II complex MNN10 subunit